MKKFLLKEDCNWYRANLHCHSVISDGQMTPEELKAAYKKEGYSILAISDHEILADHSDLDDDEFLTLTSVEYSVGEMTPKYPALVPKGKEGDWQYSKTMHFNLFAKDQHNTFQPATDVNCLWGGASNKYAASLKCDNFKREYTIKSINELIKRSNDAGFLVQYNHPYWSLNTRDEYLNLKGLWSLEILNYGTELETGVEEASYVYDDMLRSGMMLYCSMGDDNHNPGKSLVQSFGGSTIIGADELKYDKIIKAMEEGNFYCTAGPRIHALYVEDGKVKIDCSEASAVYINEIGRTFRPYIGENITHAEFDLCPENVFFRITVRDKYGRNAHTNAYYIKDLID